MASRSPIAGRVFLRCTNGGEDGYARTEPGYGYGCGYYPHYEYSYPSIANVCFWHLADISADAEACLLSRAKQTSITPRSNVR
jgi:hypothetical protein